MVRPLCWDMLGNCSRPYQLQDRERNSVSTFVISSRGATLVTNQTLP